MYVAVYLILVRDNKVLLLQRAKVIGINPILIFSSRFPVGKGKL